MTVYKNFPFRDVTREAEKHFRNGAIVFQKWTCEGCGHRLEGAPNTWTEQGVCEDLIDGKVCGHVTDMRKTGCNYSLIWTNKPATIMDMAKRVGPIGQPKGKA